MTDNACVEILDLMVDLRQQGKQVAHFQCKGSEHPLLYGRFDDLWITFAPNFWAKGLHNMSVRGVIAGHRTSPGFMIGIDDEYNVRKLRVHENIAVQPPSEELTAITVKAKQHFIRAKLADISDVEEIFAIAACYKDTLVGLTMPYFESEFIQYKWGFQL